MLKSCSFGCKLKWDSWVVILLALCATVSENSSDMFSTELQFFLLQMRILNLTPALCLPHALLSTSLIMLLS